VGRLTHMVRSRTSKQEPTLRRIDDTGGVGANSGLKACAKIGTPPASSLV